MKTLHLFLLPLLFILSGCAGLAPSLTNTYVPDRAYERDSELLTKVQRDTFNFMWEHSYPSGMVFENNRYADGPATTGGTGFGVAALVVGVERDWISREQAVERLLTLTTFLKDKTDRKRLHGAFPHWINGITGATMPFGQKDIGADLVETAFLLQGLLIAQAYFDAPNANESTIRAHITEMWHDVDWNWFTKGENNGLYWHWSPEYGFEMNMKVSGFNECMVTYVLAAASPTHPISPEAAKFWYSTHEYEPKSGNGYTLEAGIEYSGPLFITHYSYIGLDPRHLADDHVRKGYWVRNVTQTLMNRAYCLESAPAEHQYSPGYWGLTSSDAKDYYRYNAPGNEVGTVAPTAALSSMPYTPHYSMEVLWNLHTNYADKIWGPYGPYDAFSLKENWFAATYQAIDQLPIVCMIENYRSGLLWNLFMENPEVQRGINRMGMYEPQYTNGFPLMVLPLKLENNVHVPDAVDLRRHPDTGLYTVPYYSEKAAPVTFTLERANNATPLFSLPRIAQPGHNELTFPPFSAPDTAVYHLRMELEGNVHILPLRLH